MTTRKTAAPSRSAGSSAPTATPAPASVPPVREGEDPWMPDELSAIREAIETDISQLEAEIHVAESDIASLMRDAGDGSGDDQADAGAKTFEREQEITLANNARDLLEQNQHALERLNAGGYGVCESCGLPIGKFRLQAAPRATLCVSCKQKQERR